ncbi:transcriptional regulator [Brachybacterium endophyticum]|uniref:Transcriptional regulator n=2 Tax=Brachybacterium endophyticum TaxID=2182385 RepID=A0A2U2RMM7_9MICO|nr:transcriptional regulator [Brachybacterium endophyticum]
MDEPRTGVRLGSSSTVTALGPRDQEPEQPDTTETGTSDADHTSAPGADDSDRPASPGSPSRDRSGAERRAGTAAAATGAAAAGGAALASAGSGSDGSRSGGPAGSGSAADGSAATGSGGVASGGSGSGGSGSGPRGPRSGGPAGPGRDDSAPSGRGGEGSLPRAAGWTVLTTFIPGTGLLSTKLKRVGWVILGVLVIALAALAIWFAAGDPLLTTLKFVSSRKVLIAMMVAIAVIGLIWILQVVASNLAHNTKERLQGRRRIISLLIAVVMVIGIALPLGRAEQYVFAAQGLLGNENVFRSSGGKGGNLGSGKDAWKGKERVNILLLGQDAGSDREGTRPDTIMVASIDTKTGRTALFSLPRNLEKPRFPKGTVAQKEFPRGFDYYGKGQNLINAVWSWADENKDLFPEDTQNPGLTATEWAVEEATGLGIDYYSMVNLQGFSDLVDTMGGVDINVERKIPIGGGTNQATGGKYPISGYIEPGQQNLDGDKALWYARSREGSTDFNRICRQQRMVRVVSEQTNPTKLALNFTDLVGVAGSNIETDIPSDDLDAFVDLGWKVKDAGFASYPIQPGVDLPDRQRKSYFVDGHPDWKYLKTWVQESIDDSMKTTESTSVAGTDDAKKKNKASESAESTKDEKTEEPSDEPSASDSSTKSDEDKAAKEAKEQAEADPLAACMPGTQDPDAEAGD